MPSPGKLQELAWESGARKQETRAKRVLQSGIFECWPLKENGITLNSECLINFDKVCERIDRTFRRAHIKVAIWRGLQQ